MQDLGQLKELLKTKSRSQKSRFIYGCEENFGKL